MRCCEQVRDDPGLSGLSDKDLAKRVMPFVQFHTKEALRSGKQVSRKPQALRFLLFIVDES